MTLTIGLVAFGTLLFAWQDPKPAQQPQPKASHIQVLRKAVRACAAADLRYNSSTGAERAANRVSRNAAREVLKDSLTKFEQATQQPLVLDADALLEVFEDAFAPAKTPPANGVTVCEKEGEERVVFLPDDYEPSKAQPTVVLIGGRKQRGDAAAMKAYLEETWGEAARREHMTVIAPVVPPDVDLDRAHHKGPDKEKLTEEAIAAVFRPLGAAWMNVHSSRDRVVIDCGRGASAFGLRLVSMFPDRFAGIVLRWPVADDTLRVEALQGMPVLLIRSPETKATCDRLRKQLNVQTPGSCQVLTPPGEYPFAGETGIAEWSRQQRRDAMAKRVVVAPIHDRFHHNRWIRIRRADPVAGAPKDNAPLLIADADREKNTITVTARGVQAFTVMVGPSLVDVRDFTLIVNGKEQNVKLQPSFDYMFRSLSDRFDPGILVTGRYKVSLD